MKKLMLVIGLLCATNVQADEQWVQVCTVLANISKGAQIRHSQGITEEATIYEYTHALHFEDPTNMEVTKDLIHTTYINFSEYFSPIEVHRLTMDSCLRSKNNK